MAESEDDPNQDREVRRDQCREESSPTDERRAAVRRGGDSHEIREDAEDELVVDVRCADDGAGEHDDIPTNARDAGVLYDGGGIMYAGADSMT